MFQPKNVVRRLKEDLNLDSILNLVLLPKNYKMKIMKSCTARHRADHAPGQLYRYDDAAAWHLPAKFMVPIRLYGEIEVKTGTELGPEQNIRCQVCIYYYGSG